jgi:uncharacterized membrane protein YoaK (UPF0700 family)
MAIRRGILGLSLTAMAGWLDAVGFLRLQGFYVSFMSGNTTRLGASIAEGQWPLIILGGSVLALFFAGSFIGGLTTAFPERWALVAILALEAVLLTITVLLSAGDRDSEAMLVLPLAMGVQNGAVHQLRPSATTFVTGTLFGAGHGLARSIVGARDTMWLFFFVTWLSFAFGAAGGALGNDHWGMMALLIPLFVVVLCGVASFAGAEQPGKVRA